MLSDTIFNNQDLEKTSSNRSFKSLDSMKSLKQNYYKKRALIKKNLKFMFTLFIK